MAGGPHEYGVTIPAFEISEDIQRVFEGFWLYIYTNIFEIKTLYVQNTMWRSLLAGNEYEATVLQNPGSQKSSESL